MKLSQLRNNKSPTSLKSHISIDFRISHQYILGNLPSISEWSGRLSSYDPDVLNYICGKCPDCQDQDIDMLSNYKYGPITTDTQKMSYYKKYWYISNNITGYKKLSKFRK